MAGYRSLAFRWFTGYSVGVEPPAEGGCPCPEYKVDGTLANTWRSDTCETSMASLPFTIPMFRLYRLGYQPRTYKQEATLVNAWARKACD